MTFLCEIPPIFVTISLFFSLFNELHGQMKDRADIFRLLLSLKMLG